MPLFWYHWAVLGVALVVAELFIPAFVLVWFGLGALCVAALMSLVPDTAFIPQILLWTVASVAMVLVWFKVFAPHRHKVLAGRSSAQVVGEIGLLVHDVGPFQRGQVRFQKPIVGSDRWECIADEPIKNGSRVQVAAIEGSMLKVTRA
jgi:membrane protein implicated in regulation of membrane protease activity